VSYKLYDKIDNVEVGLKDAMASIRVIFDIDEDELMSIFDKWADEQAIILNNQIADIRYKLYEETGVELELTTKDLNNLMDNEYPYLSAILNDSTKLNK
jgi:phage I-like protein